MHHTLFTHSFPRTTLSFPAAASNFVDGDLVERFLDLPHDKMREVADGFQRADENGVMRDVSVQELIQVVEEMTRLH